MPLLEQQHQTLYQQILCEQLSAAKARNPNFSLRSFAKRLGISPPLLSQLISGTRNLTLKSAQKISENLVLSPAVATALANEAKGRHRKNLGIEKGPKPRVIDEDHFHMIADWYHYAILSLADIPDNIFSDKWVAERLGISTENAGDALARLVRLGLIKDTGKGKGNARSKKQGFCRTCGQLETSQDIPSSAIKKYHQQSIEKALVSLYRDSVEQRYFGSITAAIDPSDLPELKKVLRKFRADFQKKADKCRKKQVYQLCLQLFPIDNPETSSKEKISNQE